VSTENRVELSAITVTPGGLGEIAETLEALRAQSAADRVEMVIVAPRELDVDVPETEGFGAVRVVTDQLESLGRAITGGLLAASAPAVAYAEEHSIPQPGWAAGLIERHRGPWVAVGWTVENANPATAASWAHMISDFGPGMTPVVSGERFAPMPWHHVSYKREALAARGDRLCDLVEAEGVLQEELLAEGGRFYMDGGVSSRHLNISRTRENWRSHWYGGRGFGAARARFGRWSAARRLAYALAFPIVPLIRFNRHRADLARTRESRGRVPGLVPALFCDLIVDAFGEAVGYTVGEGDSRQHRLAMETDRRSFLAARDPVPEAPAGITAGT
jgi:hypothetical protein